MDIGTVIKTTRQKQGIKQKDLAVQCDITAAYLSQIESNLKDPNLSTLRTISKQLGSPLPILFFLALDESDIPTEKQPLFKHLKTPIQSFVSEFFVA